MDQVWMVPVVIGLVLTVWLGLAILVAIGAGKESGPFRRRFSKALARLPFGALRFLLSDNVDGL